jgi:hypothetical protein
MREPAGPRPAQLAIQQLLAPGVKLARADLMALACLRNRRARRKRLANDPQLLLKAPAPPPRNAADNLNAPVATTHTTSRLTARSPVTLADQTALLRKQRNGQDYEFSRKAVPCLRPPVIASLLCVANWSRI